MKRIAIDMDDVVADAQARFGEWYARDYGIELTPEQLYSASVQDLIKPEHSGCIREFVFHDDFFKDLPVIKDAKEVIAELYKKYEIYFTTAAMEFPNSLLPKLAWLGEHFPYVTWKNIVFCGDKSIINADYMIDDNVRNFNGFIGQGILFKAAHNHDVRWDVKVNNWQEVKEMLL